MWKNKKNMLCNDYQFDFFANKPLKAITFGTEGPGNVAQHMLSSADVGIDSTKKFVKKGLVKQEMSVFDKITKVKLKTGIKKLPKTPKLVEALKEDI